MKFGFYLMADVTEIGFFSHVEALGYSSVWVADSQMLFSDCYAVLALAARQTSRLRIGPGTAICGTRIAPVQAAAMATINALAPGRVFLGIDAGIRKGQRLFITQHQQRAAQPVRERHQSRLFRDRLSQPLHWFIVIRQRAPYDDRRRIAEHQDDMRVAERRERVDAKIAVRHRQFEAPGALGFIAAGNDGA
jgi:hypothetical protein